MKEQLRILSKLQSLEQRKRVVTNQKGNCETGDIRQLWQEIRLLGQSIAAEKEKLVCLEKVCTRQEEDLSSATKHCQQMESKLYGGDITNLKELDQMKGKCDSLRKDVVEREDEVVAHLEYCEQLAGLIAQSEKELQEKKRLHAEKQQLLTQALADIDNELLEITTEYDELYKKVDPELMNKFKSLARKLSHPVARLENSVCSGCRRSIPTNQLEIIKTSVVQCDNCGRFLLAE